MSSKNTKESGGNMFKVNEENSNENLAKISKLIDGDSNGKTYNSLYGYQEKNLIIIKTLTHYAIGFNDDEVIAIPMTADGEKTKDAMRFKVGEETKVTISGMIALSNGTDKIKLQVPGMIPKVMGMKQLEVTQVEKTSTLFELLKSC